MTTQQKRARAKLRSGMGVPEIHKQTGVPLSTLYYWQKRKLRAAPSAWAVSERAAIGALDRLIGLLRAARRTIEVGN